MKVTDLTFLFPADPLNPHEPDTDYAEEYHAAGLVTNVSLIDLDLLLVQGKLKVNRDLSLSTLIVYRGWMLTPEKYILLQDLINDAGARLLTDGNAYKATHLLPSWAHHANTLKSAWTFDLKDEALVNLLSQFSGPVTVKDFVKSRKYEWDAAFFIPEARDYQQALTVIHNFIQHQAENLVGGIVIREFVPLLRTGTHLRENLPMFEEYRVFYWRSSPFVIIDYWNHNLKYLDESDQLFIRENGRDINSPFFTIDFARKPDGSLIIMEIGDGQVSGLQDYDVNHFYSLLFNKIAN